MSGHAQKHLCQSWYLLWQSNNNTTFVLYLFMLKQSLCSEEVALMYYLKNWNLNIWMTFLFLFYLSVTFQKCYLLLILWKSNFNPPWKVHESCIVLCVCFCQINFWNFLFILKHVLHWTQGFMQMNKQRIAKFFLSWTQSDLS